MKKKTDYNGISLFLTKTLDYDLFAMDFEAFLNSSNLLSIFKFFFQILWTLIIKLKLNRLLSMELQRGAFFFNITPHAYSGADLRLSRSEGGFLKKKHLKFVRQFFLGQPN